MPGKRRDFAGSFAMLEVAFILRDPRIHSLTLGAKWWYITLWCTAVEERRETLPEWFQIATISLRAGCDRKTGLKAAKQLQEKSLIAIDEKGRITACGVRTKHPNLTWKDGDISENMHPQIVAQSESESESESEVVLKTPTESSAEPTPEEPTRELSGHQKDIRDVTDFWQAHFIGNGKEPPSPSFVGKILVNCRRVGVSPTWLIGKIKPDHANAEAMALFYFKPGESLPSMTDAERRDNSYAAWERRDRGGGTLLGDVLRKRIGAENEAET